MYVFDILYLSAIFVGSLKKITFIPVNVCNCAGDSDSDESTEEDEWDD